jgi:DHA2 family multidrug resistance protein
MNRPLEPHPFQGGPAAADVPASAMGTLTPAHTRLLLIGLGLATGMEFYTFDSMNLVLADLTGTLGVSADEASWLLTVYSCSLFLGVPISIWMAGHYRLQALSARHHCRVRGSRRWAVRYRPNLDAMLIWRAAARPGRAPVWSYGGAPASTC